MTTPAEPSSGPEPRPGTSPGGWGPPPGWQQQPGAQQPPPGWQQPPPGWQPAAGPSGWGPGQPGGAGGPVTSDDTTWALLAHLSYFVLGLLGPLVIYLVKKDTSPFVRQHSAEALNFHITVTIALIASAVLMLVIIGFLTFFAVLVAGAVYAVLAAIAANKGQPYRYPFTLRLVS